MCIIYQNIQCVNILPGYSIHMYMIVHVNLCACVYFCSVCILNQSCPKGILYSVHSLCYQNVWYMIVHVDLCTCMSFLQLSLNLCCTYSKHLNFTFLCIFFVRPMPGTPSEWAHSNWRLALQLQARRLHSTVWSQWLWPHWLSCRHYFRRVGRDRRAETWAQEEDNVGFVFSGAHGTPHLYKACEFNNSCWVVLAKASLLFLSPLYLTLPSTCSPHPPLSTSILNCFILSPLSTSISPPPV